LSQFLLAGKGLLKGKAPSPTGSNLLFWNRGEQFEHPPIQGPAANQLDVDAKVCLPPKNQEDRCRKLSAWGVWDFPLRSFPQEHQSRQIFLRRGPLTPNHPSPKSPFSSFLRTFFFFFLKVSALGGRPNSRGCPEAYLEHPRYGQEISRGSSFDLRSGLGFPLSTTRSGHWTHCKHTQPQMTGSVVVDQCLYEHKSGTIFAVLERGKKFHAIEPGRVFMQVGGSGPFYGHRRGPALKKN